MPYWGWLIVLGLFLIAEAITVQLVTIWFALGALSSLISSLMFDDMLWLEIAVFIVVSTVALIATRPFVKKLRKTHNTATNADRVIGTTAIVTESIDNMLGKGAINVSGVPWTARSIDNSAITVGSSVRVEQIEGVKLIVSPVKTEV